MFMAENFYTLRCKKYHEGVLNTTSNVQELFDASGWFGNPAETMWLTRAIWDACHWALLTAVAVVCDGCGSGGTNEIPEPRLTPV